MENVKFLYNFLVTINVAEHLILRYIYCLFKFLNNIKLAARVEHHVPRKTVGA